MNFEKYQHIERLASSDVFGILQGKCYITPKIDGTNSSIWLGEDGEVHCGSRNRDLTNGEDNAGFREWVKTQPQFKAYLQEHPTHRLYGEWLVPHTIRDYVDTAWRKFYVFDVVKNEGKEMKYLPYEEYAWRLDVYGILYLKPLAILENPTIDQLKELMENNHFLMKDGAIGEGVVVKNYNFVNKYGLIKWGKLVRAEFHEKKGQKPQSLKGYGELELEIASKYVTEALVLKEKAKIENEMGGWSSKYIKRLLGVVWRCIVEEELWDILKKYKNPTINFRELNIAVINRIKAVVPDLF